jgi:hypothetical protein
MKLDRAALDRALELSMADDDREYSKLAEEGWFGCAWSCAHDQQCKALNLFPWQSPPCDVDEGDIGIHDFGGAKLLKRMLAHGVSRYDPTPLDAIAAARR